MAKSFRQMIEAGEAKRADAIKIQLDDIHERPGFNERDEGEDLEQSIAELADFISTGALLPPLEVVPREEGGVWLVDGHRRRRAYLLAREKGALSPDKDGKHWIRILPFEGDETKQIARIVSSNTNKELTPLQKGRVYKRLADKGLSLADIAKETGKTRQHVEQCLVLARSGDDVKQLVADGAVSARVAIEIVREHKEEAGAVIAKELERAKEGGKAKVTLGTMKKPVDPNNPTMPRSILDDLAQQAEKISASLSKEDRIILDAALRGDEQAKEATISIKAETLLHFELCMDELRRIRSERIDKAHAKAQAAKQTDIEDAKQ